MGACKGVRSSLSGAQHFTGSDAQNQSRDDRKEQGSPNRNAYVRRGSIFIGTLARRSAARQPGPGADNRRPPNRS